LEEGGPVEGGVKVDLAVDVSKLKKELVKGTPFYGKLHDLT
jgi:hypothetical protein